MSISRIVQNIAVVSFLALIGTLTIAQGAKAQNTSQYIMRGPHGAFFILEPKAPSDSTSVNVVKPVVEQTFNPVPMVITRGPHGGGFVVNEVGVGGPEGSGVYPGFPNLVTRGPHGASALR